ncbi:MAG: ATP-binding protein [Bacteroidia bacterium]|nr:ATP-binding protein [Bacteroidia bacterium]
MKKLPIGKQDFAELINKDCIYVDKTEILYKLISDGFYYFLSRPRRFGKSLTVSTLKEIFGGNKELFKSLWIYDKLDWKKYPIIYIDFSEIGVKELGTEQAILNELENIALKNNIKITGTTPGIKFRELIQALAKEAQVVILIDEYDKPIIDYMDNIPQAEMNREILKNFYSVLKGNDEYIKFLFITGVSKFSKVSIFSDLNHLNDITINPNFSVLTGYTEDDLEKYFSEYIALAQNELNEFFPDVKLAIKNWYNGYSWDGKKFVYNPFSLLNFFSNRRFDDYWFQTGTPTFLMKLLKENNYKASSLSEFETDISLFDKYEISDIQLIPLLFQTGYLTIKKYNILKASVILDYPNKEVQKSFENYIFSTFSEKHISENRKFLNDIIRALNSNDIAQFIHLFKILFKGIAYPHINNKENYYHSIFYLIIKLLGFDIETEVFTCDGRIDAAIKTDNHIYIIEFKLGKAKNAIEQIREKEYALKYANDGRKIILIGIGFSTKKKNVDDYIEESYNS